tara:strand:+ start:1031 stop:1717 length:687 start_codon:yes stop_codon:yes gene_type:complete
MKTLQATPTRPAAFSDSAPPDIHKSADYWESYIRARGEAYRESWLNNYTVSHPGQAEVLAMVRQYGQTVADRVERGQNLIFFGSKGTGKDHLMTAIIRQAIRATGRPVTWTTGADLFAACKATFDERGNSDSDIIRQAINAPVWAISDPTPVFGERLTRYEAEILYRIADGRSNHRRATFVSVNVLSRGDLDKTISPKTADRFVCGAMTAFCHWPSFRTATETANKPR